jgi:hypothetical protein
MKEYSAFEFNPEMSPASQKLFNRFRLLTVTGLLVAIAVSSLVTSLVAG